MAEEPTLKKRKVEVVEVFDDEEDEITSVAAPAETVELEESKTETPEAEIERLKQTYKKAQDTIATMETLRRGAASRLLELGQRSLPESIADPWTPERLKTEIAERESEFFQDLDREIGADEDATHTERFDATYIQRLKDALEGERPCDAEGYITEEGGWIKWIPTDEELEDFHWEDVGFYPNG